MNCFDKKKFHHVEFEKHSKKFHWDSTLSEILRSYLDLDVTPPWSNLTLREMLIYKSGPSAADMSTMTGLPLGVAREELVRRSRFLPQEDEFRGTNHYSNYMYTIVSYLAERMSGRSWNDLVKVHVLDIQNMNGSFSPEGMGHIDAALPYRFDPTRHAEFEVQNRTLFNLHPFESVGSLMVSAGDIVKWLRHLIHVLNDKGDDPEINQLIKDAFQTWVAVPEGHQESSVSHDSEVAEGYGMGWYVSTYNGFKRFKFSGSLYAYNSQIWLFPEQKSGIFIAVNGPGTDQSQYALDSIMYYISDIVLRKTPWINKTQLCPNKDADPEIDPEGDDAAPLQTRIIQYLAPVENYIGTYGHGIVGNAVVEYTSSKILRLKIGQNLIGELIPDGSESRMKFLATGALLNTEEWKDEKTVEFLSLESNRFTMVRIHINDKLFYEFKRGSLFETMLELAEAEDERLLREHHSTATVTVPPTTNDNVHVSDVHVTQPSVTDSTSHVDANENEHASDPHTTQPIDTDTYPTESSEVTDTVDIYTPQSLENEITNENDVESTEQTGSHFSHLASNEIHPNETGHHHGDTKHITSDLSGHNNEIPPYNVNVPDTEEKDHSTNDLDKINTLNPDSPQSHEPYSDEEVEQKVRDDAKKVKETELKAQEKNTKGKNSGCKTATTNTLVSQCLLFFLIVCWHLH
ncbi:uncharacterized protein LOC131938878 [Physella acuta]|uniref:uncharacterized protein LOC131938878 n=1 Tax=Physella acuta TaxID=109671 RepID=UPI0027DD01E2|nr:uncharacterized protein LOC131938878 [Physella acuta]